ncbi:probable transporter mch1 [Phtheirospermum japonicum]|uniref:Probable transporter mch1 n=1 Tax=Phtheirospermum japonicum TaxID=374723 RepID=A0A830B368_9LAMI|nr:probable transporter mch1 [Phtheirospermum japonicum]
MDVDYNPSRKSLFKNKWITMAAGIWIQSAAGSLYTFSIYSPILKSTQGYDQSTLNIISVFKDFGANVGILAGLLYSAASGRAGPWVVLLAGAVQCFAGYFLMWLTVTGALPPAPPSVVCCYMLLAAHAMSFFNTANVVTGVHNFPSYGGTVVGIMKTEIGMMIFMIFIVEPECYGLSWSEWSHIDSSVSDNFQEQPQFIFIATGIASHSHISSTHGVSYLTAVIIIQNYLKLKLSIRVSTFLLLIFLLVSPIFVAIAAQRDKSYRVVKSLLEHNQISDERDILVEDVSNITQDHGEYHEIPNSTDVIRETNNDTLLWGQDLNILQAMRTINFWFLFFTTACAIGSGLTAVNNLSQIGESLGYTSLEINTLVSLWSIWNFVGRFGAGYISDYFLHVKGCPRPLFIVITLAFMSIGHAMIAFGFSGALYAGSVLVGVCYGSQWTLMPTIASELFGKVHLGTIFNTITIAGPIGSYVLSVKVVGYIYDKEVSEYGKTCTGTRCFMLSFIIMASVTDMNASQCTDSRSIVWVFSLSGMKTAVPMLARAVKLPPFGEGQG